MQLSKKHFTSTILPATLIGGTLLFASGCFGPNPEPVLSSRGGVIPEPRPEPQEPVAAPSGATGEETASIEDPAKIEPPEETDDEEITEPPDVEPDTVTYTVRKGDTLWGISQKYGVTHQELAAHNDMEPGDVLRVGKKLGIPPGGTSPEDSGTQEDSPQETEETPSPSGDVEEQDLPSDNKYTVERGDSLWEISQKFGVSMDQIRELNDLESDQLQVGQVLILAEEGAGGQANVDQSPTEEDDEEDGDSSGPAAGDDDSAPDDSDGRSFEPPENSNDRGNGGSSSVSKTLEHTVMQDETVSKIADMYGTSADKILKANEELDSSKDLEEDMTITVPYEE